MLTPEVTDPNRNAELARAKKDPRSFGTPRLDTKEITARKLEGHLLVTEQGLRPTGADAAAESEEQRIAREAAEKAAQGEKDRLAQAEVARIRKEWEDYLDQPVGVLINELSNVQDTGQLAVMQTIESETKNRKTLIEAIVAEITKRGE